MAIRVQTDGGAGPSRPAVLGRVARHVTAMTPVLAAGSDGGFRPIGDDVNGEIARHAYALGLRHAGDHEEADRFQRGDYRPRFDALVAMVFRGVESTVGRIPGIPDSFRQWANRVQDERDGIPGEGLIQIDMPPQWLADP